MFNCWKGEGKGPEKGIVGNVSGSVGQCEHLEGEVTSALSEE